MFHSMSSDYSRCYPRVNSNGNAHLDNNRYMSAFGDRIRARRKELGMSQPDLAKAAGLKQPTISNIERGRNRGSAYVVQLAHALKCAAQWLATGKGKPDQDEVESPYSELLSKYRQADPHTRQIIDTILNRPQAREAVKPLAPPKRKTSR